MKALLDRLSRRPTVAVLRLDGVISAQSGPGPGGISDKGLAPLIEKAFSSGKPAAVALAINSPGGSPVQSALVAARIRRLSAEKGVPVFAFCEDVAASGGYWIALAADEIYADTNSLVGSIGVISAGFGLAGLIERYGIERRVYTAGTSKMKLDPFQAEKAEDVDWLKGLQADLHDSFIAEVRARRGDKLAEADLFNGDVFLGQRAVSLGLIDGIGHLVPTMKERFGDKVRFTVLRQRRSLAQRFGLPNAGDVLQSLEDRALWARYGL